MSASAGACFVTGLESTADGSTHQAGVLQTVHENRPLLVRYDLDAIARRVARSDIARREPTLWRYRELLPLRDDHHRVTLGESITPLLPCPRLARALGLRALWIKDESRLPTGSFKARGMAMAVSMAKELGVTEVAVPTQGNAGGALAAYAARAGMACHVFMPADTPLVNRLEITPHGARAFLVDGLIHDCGAIVREGAARFGWFDMSTLREPYRLEGKKTMGLELAEQMDWRLPDAILYPTGGGTGLIGMWKAFDELAHLGWLEDDRRPRLFACQSSGCPTLALAFERGEDRAASVPNPHTRASGLRVPKALADFLILQAVRASGGRAMAADESRITTWMHQCAALEGIALCPEAAICVGVLEDALRQGHLTPDDRVVIFNTGAMQKYVELLDDQPPLPRIEPNQINWHTLR